MQLARGWSRWAEVHHEEQRAAAVMQRCLGRIENVAAAGGMDKWLEVIADAKRAETMSESDMMKARIERERQEKAGRLLQYTLNKIVDSKYVQAWDRWQEVHKAMERAGRIMHRVMCRFTNAQLVGGWERWMDVWEAQRHAAAVMQRCLGRIENIAIASGLRHQSCKYCSSLTRPLRRLSRITLMAWSLVSFRRQA